MNFELIAKLFINYSTGLLTVYLSRWIEGAAKTNRSRPGPTDDKEFCFG